MGLMTSVAEFCHQHRISRGLFYVLGKDGRAPKIAWVTPKSGAPQCPIALDGSYIGEKFTRV